MITPMQMYWLLKLDDIINISLAMFVLTLLGFVICLTATIMYKGDEYYEDEYKKFRVGRNILFWFVLFFGSIVMFVPSTKQMAAIYIVPALTNNERVQNIGNKTLDVSEDLLKLTEQYLQAVSIDKR
jgi:hypothetical protein